MRKIKKKIWNKIYTKSYIQVSELVSILEKLRKITPQEAKRFLEMNGADDEMRDLVYLQLGHIWTRTWYIHIQKGNRTRVAAYVNPDLFTLSSEDNLLRSKINTLKNNVRT